MSLDIVYSLHGYRHYVEICLKFKSLIAEQDPIQLRFIHSARSGRTFRYKFRAVCVCVCDIYSVHNDTYIDICDKKRNNTIRY